MNLKRMRDDTTSTSHTGSGEPACEVCGARGRTVTGTAQAQGGLVFPIRQKGGGGEKTAKETDTSPAAAQCPRRQQHCRAGELVLRGDYKLVSVHTKYIVRFFFFFFYKIK